MNLNKIINLLISAPVILLLLYLIPFLGVILLGIKVIKSSSKERISIIIILILLGIIMFIPKFFDFLFSLIKINSKVPYLNEIVNSDFYINLIEYGKRLVIVGVITLIIIYALRNLLEKIKSYITDYIRKKEQIEREVAQENDMKIKIKQENAKNTNYIRCPHCGSDNITSEKFTVCKFCRRNIVNK